MEETTYQVVFSGALAEGADPAQVKANLAKLFRTTPDKLSPLFSGKPVVVKGKLDRATAEKYQLAMQRAGVLCEVQATPEQVSPPSPPVAASPAASVGETVSLSPRGAVTIAAPASTQGLEQAGVAPVGSDLVEAELVEVPDIDTAALSLAEQTGNLVDYQPVPEPEIDISALSAAEPGEDLVEPVEVPEPQIDISRISLAPEGTDLGERKGDPPPPPPDVSHLSLSKD